MTDDVTQFTMRISNKVYEQVKASAERNKRSIAKEIEYILEEWTKPPKDVEVSPEMSNALNNLIDLFKKEKLI